MRRRNLDLAAAAIVAIVTSAAAIAGAPNAVMVVPGLALFVVPGVLWTDVLLGQRVRGLARAACAGTLMLALPVLGGLPLYAAGVALSRLAWVGLLTEATLIAVIVLFFRRRTAPEPGIDPERGEEEQVADDRDAATRRGRFVAGELVVLVDPRTTGERSAPGQRPRISRWNLAAFGLAAVVAAGGVGFAYAGAARQHYPGFTQLSLVDRHGTPAAAAVGVTNQLDGPARFRLIVLRKGAPPVRWDLDLANGRTWQHMVPFDGSTTMTANLYRLPDVTHPYRHVVVYEHPVF